MDVLSRERIGQEFLKLLSAPDPAPALATMAQCNVLRHEIFGADPKFIGPVQHLEQLTETPPEPLRRLAVLGGQDVSDALRLSKAQAKHLASIQAALGATLTDKALGYVYGADAAWSAMLINAAMAAVPLSSTRRNELIGGAQAEYTVKARDLPAELSGPAIGKELSELTEL